MKIRMVASVAGNADERYGIADFSFGVGQEVEVHKTLAGAWIKSGQAVAVDASAPAGKAAKGAKVAPAEKVEPKVADQPEAAASEDGEQASAQDAPAADTTTVQEGV